MGQKRYRKGQIIGVKGQAGQAPDNPTGQAADLPFNNCDRKAGKDHQAKPCPLDPAPDPEALGSVPAKDNTRGTLSLLQAYPTDHKTRRQLGRH